jgi:hypothetical protein
MRNSPQNSLPTALAFRSVFREGMPQVLEPVGVIVGDGDSRGRPIWYFPEFHIDPRNILVPRVLDQRIIRAGLPTRLQQL